jgi:hypothetical protein
MQLQYTLLVGICCCGCSTEVTTMFLPFPPWWLTCQDEEEGQEESMNQVEEEEERCKKHGRFLLMAAHGMLLDYSKGRKAQFRDLLNLEGIWRRDRRIPRCALLEPWQSPWAKLWSSGNDQAFITATGFDFSAFSTLLALFKPYFEAYTPWTGNHQGKTVFRMKKRKKKGPGRPRKIDAKTCLALVLTWYRFNGGEFILQGWFGLTGTPANVWLKFGRRLLIGILYRNDLARIRLPSDENVKEYQQIVHRKHPALKNVYCVADGLKIRFQNTDGELDEQSMYYNGWQHGHYITNLELLDDCQ